MVVKKISLARDISPGAVAVTWLFILAGLWSCADGGVLLAQYPGPADAPLRFSHMAVDLETGNLYVAATNMLLQLDSNLRLLYNYSTGPILVSYMNIYTIFTI